MRELYLILCVIGWVWCLVVAVFLWAKLRRARAEVGANPQEHKGRDPETGQEVSA